MTEKIKPNTLFNDRYLIEGFLGAGGMSNVYLARDTENEDQKVALKVLEFGDGDNRKRLQRFQQEIEIIDGIHSRNVVDLLDYHADAEPYYYTMEYFEGESLEDIASNSMSLKRVVHLAINVIRGLESIHEYGITHRDLKPGNIIVNKHNEVKIIDFGIAKANHSKLTSDGEMVGSFDYMPPEVWKGGYITAKTDVYSLGVVLYLLTTGKLPFNSTNMSNLMYQHLEGHIVFPSELNKSMPYWLGELILQMLEIEPGLRPNLAAIKNTIIDNSGLEQYRDEERLESSAIQIANRNLTSTQTFKNEISNLSQLDSEAKKTGFKAAYGVVRNTEPVDFSSIYLIFGSILALCFLWLFADNFASFQANLATDAINEPVGDVKYKLRLFVANAGTLAIFISLIPLSLVFSTARASKVFSKVVIVPFVYFLMVSIVTYLISMVSIDGLPQHNISLILNKFNLIFTKTIQVFFEVALLVPIPATVRWEVLSDSILGFFFHYNGFYYVTLLIYLYSLLLFNRTNLKIKYIRPNPHTYLLLVVFLLHLSEYLLYLILVSQKISFDSVHILNFGIYSFKITTFNLVCSIVNWLVVITYLIMSPRVRLKTDDIRLRG